MAGGRPTDLTPEVVEDVRRLLPTVLYLETVADYIGVNRLTMRRWLKRGAKELKRLARPGAKPKNGEALYAEFCAVFKKALAEGLLCDLGVIKKASADVTAEDGTVIRKGEWQAAAWRAERRFPALWGRKDRLEHTGKGGSVVVLKVVEQVVKAPGREGLPGVREEVVKRAGAGEDRPTP